MAEQNPPIALLLIDVINDLEFPEGRQIIKFAMPMAERTLELKKRAKAAGIPVIYVNDNFGMWQSDFNKLVERCMHENLRGKRIVEMLTPAEDDYFVLKPKHSGFFSTPLELLLNHLKIHTLILTGIAGNICVLVTAHDAYMRDYKLYVPADCTASNTKALNTHALEQMEVVLSADTRLSTELNLTKIAKESEKEGKRQNSVSLINRPGPNERTPELGHAA